MPAFLLHAQTAGVASALLAMIGMPLLAAAAGAALTMVMARLRGCPGAAAAAAIGAVLLVLGLSGDLISHAAQAAQREETLATMASRPGAAVIARLEEMEAAEANNPWHLVAAAGEGMLVVGLATACLLLWHRDRVAGRTSSMGALAWGARPLRQPSATGPHPQSLSRWRERGSQAERGWDEGVEGLWPSASVRPSPRPVLRRARTYPRWMTDPARANSWRK